MLDGRDRTIYGFHDGRRVKVDAISELGLQFRKSLAAVRRMPVDGRPIAGGYSRANGKVILYAVAAIVPLTEKVRLPPGPTHILVISRPVDDSVI